MPTAYPFPHVARIALSFLVSVKRVDSVPRIGEGIEIVTLPACRSDLPAPAYRPTSHAYEGI